MAHTAPHPASSTVTTEPSEHRDDQTSHPYFLTNKAYMPHDQQHCGADSCVSSSADEGIASIIESVRKDNKNDFSDKKNTTSSNMEFSNGYFSFTPNNNAGCYDNPTFWPQKVENQQQQPQQPQPKSQQHKTSYKKHSTPDQKLKKNAKNIFSTPNNNPALSPIQPIKYEDSDCDVISHDGDENDTSMETDDKESKGLLLCVYDVIFYVFAPIFLSHF